MATRVELNKELVATAFQFRIQQLTRGKNNAPNPLMKEIYDKDIATYQNAINTLQEIK